MAMGQGRSGKRQAAQGAHKPFDIVAGVAPQHPRRDLAVAVKGGDKGREVVVQQTGKTLETIVRRIAPALALAGWLEGFGQAIGPHHHLEPIEIQRQPPVENQPRRQHRRYQAQKVVLRPERQQRAAVAVGMLGAETQQPFLQPLRLDEVPRRHARAGIVAQGQHVAIVGELALKQRSNGWDQLKSLVMRRRWQGYVVGGPAPAARRPLPGSVPTAPTTGYRSGHGWPRSSLAGRYWGGTRPGSANGSCAPLRLQPDSG